MASGSHVRQPRRMQETGKGRRQSWLRAGQGAIADTDWAGWKERIRTRIWWHPVEGNGLNKPQRECILATGKRAGRFGQRQANLREPQLVFANSGDAALSWSLFFFQCSF